MTRTHLILVLFCLAGVFATVTPVQLLGQSQLDEVVNYDFRGEHLSQVLDRIARDTGTDLVYDPDLVRGIEVYHRAEDRSLAGLLGEILSAHNLDYLTLSSGTVVIIRRAGEEPSYGSLSGMIVDRQTGEPLPGATVMFSDASGGTNSGSAGRFAISRLLSGEHTLIFSYVGYKPVTKTLRIPPGERTQEVVELSPEPVNVAPVVVEAHKPRYPGLDFRDPGEPDRIGNSGRPIRDLHLVPGIQTGISLNDITLQGGQRSEHRLLLDGAPVYNPFAVGQMLSSFSPYAIGSVHLHRAGYGAGEGSQMAGIVSLRHEVPEKGGKELMVQADPLTANLKGVFSIERDDRPLVSVMSAVRGNLWGLYNDPNTESILREWDVIDPLVTNKMSGLDENAALYAPADHQADISFYDVHTAVRFHPDRFNTVGLSVYGGGNSLTTAVLNRSLPESGAEPYLYAVESYQWKNRMATVSWNSLPTARITLDTQVSYSRSDFSHGQDIGLGLPSRFRQTNTAFLDFASESSSRFDQIALPGTIEGNRIRHWIAQADLMYSVQSGIELRGGLRLDDIKTNVDIGEGTYLPTLASVESAMAAGYTTAIFRMGTHWQLEMGSRFTYAEGANRIFAEPRGSIQYDRVSDTPWSVKLSGGIYRQFVNEYRISNTGASAVVPEFSIWSLAGTLPVPKAWHLNASWQIEPAEDTSLRLEAYQKWQPVTAVTSYRNLLEPGLASRTDITAFATTTDMRAAGGSIRLGQRLAENQLHLLLGYDYSFTRVNMQWQFGRSVPAPWSEPHRALVQLQWNLTGQLAVTGKWQGIMGRKWAYRDAYYNFLQVTDQTAPDRFQFTSPENDRLAPFSQVDLALSYQPDVGAATMDIRLDLMNVLNRRNPVDRRLIPVVDGDQVDRYREQDRKMPGFSPSVSIRIAM